MGRFPVITVQPEWVLEPEYLGSKEKFWFRLRVGSGRHLLSGCYPILLVSRLQVREKLGVAIELTNPAAELGVQIQTADYYTIGWAPRYLRHDLLLAITQARGGYEAELVRVNPAPAPSKQRYLIEFRGAWPQFGYEDPDLEPLAA